MESIKILDVHSSFLCNYFSQHPAARDNKINEDDFFTGYTATRKYLSPDFNCPLSKPAIIPTGIKEMLVRKKDRTENYKK